MKLQEGARLGRYELRKRLGAGGMAEVWEAYDTGLTRTVAIKIVLEARREDDEFRARFLREARVVAGLRHRAILPVFDFGDEDGRLFLVMPLMPGGTLGERMRAPVTPEQAIAWLREAAAGLDQAHATGIVHRDVKPNNVLFDADGTLCIADFGLARSLDPGAEGLTTPGHIMGTAAYISPEQALGQPADARADQYALGVLAFELMVGELPFQAPTSLLVLTKHVAEAPPKATKLNPHLPRSVDAVFDRVLSKTAPERFATCSAFVAALDEALGPRQVAPSATRRPAAGKPRSASLPLPLPQPEPRRRGLGLLLLVLIGTGGLVGYLVKTRGGPAPFPWETLTGNPTPAPAATPAEVAAAASPSPSAAPAVEPKFTLVEVTPGGTPGAEPTPTPAPTPTPGPPRIDARNLDRMRVAFVRTFTGGSEAPTSVKLRIALSFHEPVDPPPVPIVLVKAVAEGPAGEKALLPAGVTAPVKAPAEPGPVRSLEVVFGEEVAQPVLADETLKTMTVRVRVGTEELETRVQIPPQERKPQAGP